MDLNKTRREINDINNEMLRLFEKRMKCAVDVAAYKLENDMPVFDEEREKFVLNSMADGASEEMRPYVREFFQNVMDLSKKYQTVLLDNKTKIKYKNVDKLKAAKIIYQGVPGSYSSEVCEDFKESETMFVERFEDVCIALKNGQADLGILPVENSSTGSVIETYELLKKYNLYIVGEKIIRVCHNILTPKGGKLEDIKEIYSHSQAFMQSSKYLDNLKNVRHISYYNTAISAKSVSEWNDTSKAAIAGMNAAKIYNLDVVAENISNNKNNYTRFIILSPERIITNNADKVSLTFILKHECGSLMKCLKSFADHNLNLMKLESRPIAEKPWQYVFFADFECPEGADIAKIIDEISQNTVSTHFLGMYKEAEK